MMDSREVADYVKLVSGDGFEYTIPRKCAFMSGTLRSMFSSPGQFAESVSNQVYLQDLSAKVLERVCQYLAYKFKYSSSIGGDIPEFSIDPDIALVSYLLF